MKFLFLALLGFRLTSTINGEECTTSGKPCLFPFITGQSQYMACTTDSPNGPTPWCATEKDAAATMTAWSPCTGAPCIATTAAPACSGSGLSLCSVQNTVNTVQTQATALTNRMATLQATIRTTLGSAGEAAAVVDATLSSGTTKCGPQTITGWTVNLDDYVASTASAVSTLKSFTASTGVFKPQVNGWYKICVFFRFKNSGNSNDVTIRKNGAVVAAFGSAIQYDWRSTGTCTLQDVSTTDSITVVHESGSSSDCIEETGFQYSRFMAHLVSCKTATCS